MTYNIHHGAGMDGKIDLQRVADVIRASGADLVALQEVDNGTKRCGGVDQAAELGQLTKMHSVYGAAMALQGGQYGDALLSRYPIGSSRLIELPWTKGNQREPRVAVSAAVNVRSNVPMLTFISTHFDHTREPSDRAAQAHAVNEAQREPFAILAGDFNCEPGSRPMETLGKEWTLVSGADPTEPTCCGDKLRVKIDHVLVKPPSAWRVIEHRVVDEPMASDHRPVVVKLELR